MIEVITEVIGPGPRRQAEQQAAQKAVQALGDGWTIAHTPEGAPFLKGAPEPPYISITHCREWLMLAYSHDCKGFGIDLERASERVERVVPRVMRPEETGLDPLLCWTAKEAVFKATGNAGAVVSDIIVDKGGHQAFLGSRRFRLTHPPSPEGYLATIAIEIANDSPDT